VVSTAENTTTATSTDGNKNEEDGFLAGFDDDATAMLKEEKKAVKLEFKTANVLNDKQQESEETELARQEEESARAERILNTEVLVDGLALEEAKDKILMLQNELLETASKHGEDVTSLSQQVEDLYFQLSQERENVAALKKQIDGDVSFDISDVKLDALNRTFIKKEKEYKEEMRKMAEELEEKENEHENKLEELRQKIKNEVSEDQKDGGMKKELDDAIQRIVNLQENLIKAKEEKKSKTTTKEELAETLKSEFSKKESDYKEKVKKLKQELNDIGKTHAAELKKAGETATTSLKKDHEEELRKRDLALEGTIQKFQKKMQEDMSSDRTYSDLVQSKERIRELEAELSQAKKQLKDETGALTKNLQDLQAAFFERENAYNYEMNKMSEQSKNQWSTVNNNPQFEYNAQQQPPPQQTQQPPQQQQAVYEPRNTDKSWYSAETSSPQSMKPMTPEGNDTGNNARQGKPLGVYGNISNQRDDHYSPQQSLDGSNYKEENDGSESRWSRWSSFGNVPFKYEQQSDDIKPVSKHAKLQESLRSHHDKHTESKDEFTYGNPNQQDLWPPMDDNNQQYPQDNNNFAPGDNYYPDNQGFDPMMSRLPEGIPINQDMNNYGGNTVNDTGDRWSSFGSNPFQYSSNPNSASSRPQNDIPRYFGEMPPPPFQPEGMIRNGPENFGSFDNEKMINDPNGQWYSSNTKGSSGNNNDLSYEDYDD